MICKFIKKLFIILTIVFYTISLFSCKGIEFENQKIAIAEELPKGESMIFVAEEKNKYENKFGNAIWNLKSGDGNVNFKDYVVSTTKKFVEKIMTFKLIAAEMNIVINSSDEEKLILARDEYENALSFDDLEFIGCTLDDIYYAYRDFHLSRLTIDNLSKNASTELSISEAKVIKVQYIIFDDYELAKKTAEEVKARGANFAYFAKTRSTETDIEMIIKRGDENSTKFPELFYLSDGQFSNVLQYRNKYYLFKCIEDYEVDETEDRRLEILTAMKNEEFRLNFEKYDTKYHIKSNSNYWRGIDLSEGNFCKIDKFEEIYYKYFPKTIK